MIAAVLLVLWTLLRWSLLVVTIDVGCWLDKPVPSPRHHVLALSGFV